MSDDNNFRKLLEQLSPSDFRALYEGVPTLEQYLVFARSHFYFKEWCHENKVHPKHARWINERKSVLGLNGKDWIVVFAVDSFIELEHQHGLSNMEYIWTVLDKDGFKWQSEGDKTAMRDWIAYRIQQIRDDAKLLKKVEFIRPRKYD